jgi:hypothetical protein
MEKDVFSDCYVIKYGKLHVYGAVGVYAGWMDLALGFPTLYK